MGKMNAGQRKQKIKLSFLTLVQSERQCAARLSILPDTTQSSVNQTEEIKSLR